MRQEAGQRRRRKRILLICALGVSALLLPVMAWWAARYCRVELAIRAFASTPSQAGTRKLIALLEKRSPTQRQATEMLKLLFWPKVATRSAYPIGKKPTVSVSLPFYLQFHNSLIVQEDIPPEGQTEPRPYPYFTHVGTMPRVLVCAIVPETLGKFHIEIQYRCLLAPGPRDLHFYFQNPVGHFLYDLLTWMKMQPGLPLPQKRWYQTRFCVPVDVNVVEPANAEQVQLVSSPELDARMREALRADTSFWYLHMHIFARRLPANVVFACFFELPDGTRVRPSWPENQHLTGYAGREFEVNLPLADSQVKRARVREAKLVFEPDPNYAFEEPTIKSIWNGRLEFPIRFPAAPEPNTGG